MDRLDQLPGQAPAELTQQRADIVVFACGDPAHAEHDSVAIAACTGLPSHALELIDLKLTGPMRPEYLRDLAPGTFVIVSDTVPGTAGEIVEVPFIELVGREEPLMTHSTPDQPLDEVVAMAELVRDAPLRGRFVGLGTADVDLAKQPDTHAVEQLRTVLARVVEEVSRI